MQRRSLRVVADDLSGVAEAAGVLHRNGFPTSVILESEGHWETSTVLDLHVRNAGSRAAASIQAGFDGKHPVDYVKIDSQLRGPVAQLVNGAAQNSAVVLAPALPRLRRTVHGGVLLIDGVPLYRSPQSAWKTEAAMAPRRLSDAIPASLPMRQFTVEEVRTGAFARALSVCQAGEVFVPDAQSSTDLQSIADAIDSVRSPIIPIGSAGLLEAIASGLHHPAWRAPASAVTAERAVLVLGSLEPVVARQHAALRPHTTTVLAPPGLESASLEALISEALEKSLRTIVVATEASSGPHDVTVAHRIGQATAKAVRHDPSIALGLIGGETARHTLQTLDEKSLVVIGEVHPGAVLCVTADGRRVVTRPGSFGDISSLTHIATTLLGEAPEDRQEEGTQ